ncbi:unnamed protein product [Gulo gulo]|uniref:HD domain-containing protein n=1 Tax=Gulo gulo TaxID=48420 RepID=A0A9X9Q9H8_GULGU|nr:unnamed protein product [Gulo gulo]
MASASAAALSGGGARNLLRFLRLVGQLKRVPRTGWVYRNVEKPESVSDHMYRMAVMALVTKDEHLNKDRCVRLALVHDMAECIVGDIAPADNIPKEEKHRREEPHYTSWPLPTPAFPRGYNPEGQGKHLEEPQVLDEKQKAWKTAESPLPLPAAG